MMRNTLLMRCGLWAGPTAAPVWSVAGVLKSGGHPPPISDRGGWGQIFGVPAGAGVPDVRPRRWRGVLFMPSTVSRFRVRSATPSVVACGAASVASLRPALGLWVTRVEEVGDFPAVRQRVFLGVTSGVFGRARIPDFGVLEEGQGPRCGAHVGCRAPAIEPCGPGTRRGRSGRRATIPGSNTPESEPFLEETTFGRRVVSVGSCSTAQSTLRARRWHPPSQSPGVPRCAASSRQSIVRHGSLGLRSGESRDVSSCRDASTAGSARKRVAAGGWGGCSGGKGPLRASSL